jgi:hypothetical protein
MTSGTVMDEIASIAKIFALAMAPFMLSVTAATQAAPSHLWEGAKNRDGSEVKLRTRLDHEAQKKSVDVLFRQSPRDQLRRIGRFDLPWDSPPQGKAFLLDWDGDGQHEVQILSGCGAGPNCDGTLYRIRKDSARLEAFFKTAGANVVLIKGHLIETGRDSCCAWSATAYVFEPKRYFVNPKPAFSVEMKSAAQEGANDPVTCTFTKVTSQGIKVISPPDKAFLKICEHYGPQYKLVRPQ